MSILTEDNIQMIEEKPVLFMILDRGGNIIVKHAFSEDLINNEHLVASFLMAINIFASEAFPYSSKLEEIKFNNYTVIIHSSNDVHFTYIFQGKSNTAPILLGKLITLIEKEMILDEILQNTVHTELFLPEKITLQINSLVR